MFELLLLVTEFKDIVVSSLHTKKSKGKYKFREIFSFTDLPHGTPLHTFQQRPKAVKKEFPKAELGGWGRVTVAQKKSQVKSLGGGVKILKKR